MIEAYRNRMAAMGGYEGEVRRRNSQKIMDASWMRDPATKPVYVKWVDSGLPIIDDDDIPVYAKFNVKSYHNITGDEIAYLLQFRLEDMKNRPDIKVGSYVQIRNEMDEPEWWLIWHLDDRTQFRQFSILKCTWVYKWTSFKDGHRIVHQCLGVTRNQNNYNSGVWLDYTLQVVEQQHVMLMPSNNDTNTIEYDSKFLVSNKGRYPPIAWKISKIQPSVVYDTVRFTMTQEQFNAATDDAELMIANYNMSYVKPELPETEETPTISDLEIIYSGSPAVRAGGGYKKFTPKLRVDGGLVDCTEGTVSLSINNRPVTFNDGVGNITESEGHKLTSLESALKFALEVSDDKKISFKVKCDPDYSLISQTFTITVQTENSSKSLIVEIASL